MPKIVMIHEVTPEVLQKDLSDFDIITFDDGLYSQYLSIDHFLKMPQPKYFFISTSIICPDNVEQSEEPLYCADAHNKARNNNFENYMTWKQIQKINSYENCFIGGHSHTHPRIKTKKLLEQHQICKSEIDNMLKSFKEYNIDIKSFCFPYNEDIIIYRALLRDFKFFGGERVPVESII